VEVVCQHLRAERGAAHKGAGSSSGGLGWGGGENREIKGTKRKEHKKEEPLQGKLKRFDVNPT